MKTVISRYFLILITFIPFVTYGFSNIESLQKTIKSTDSLKQYQFYTNTSIEIGNILFDASRYEEAIKHFKTASSLAKRFDLAKE